MDALLSANELRLSYGYQTLLEGVTLAIAAGEKVGLVGRNGCGKTSLLRILADQQAADSGEISRRRALRIGYLPQEFELDPERSVGENIAEGAADVVADPALRGGDGSEAELGASCSTRSITPTAGTLEARMKAVVTALGAPPLDAAVAPLSGGEKRRCRPVPRPRLAARLAPPRRADQPPGCRLDPLAGGLSRELRRRGDLRHPRPVFPRCHRHADHRDRPRQSLLAPRQLHRLSGGQSGPPADRRTDRAAPK
ncbi:MAG: ATP-binding cassette domain-containing protein [Verrucomicrobiales bacterium]